MPAAVAIPAIIGATSVGTSVVGGILGSRAAGKAADQQSAAANAAGQIVTDAAKSVNPTIDAAAKAAQAGMGTAVTSAQQGVTGAADQAATGVTEAAQAAGTGVTEASQQGNVILAELLKAIGDGTSPYATAGIDAVTTLGKLLQPDGEFGRGFQWDPESDQGYQFRMSEAQKAIERSAAARGTSLGGGALKALTRYSQDYASNERQRAFDNFQTERANRSGLLLSAAGLGQNAVGQGIGAGVTLGSLMSRNLMDAAEYSGNAGLTGATYAGNARTGAAEYSGNAGMSGAQYSGNVGLTSAGQQAANTMTAAEIAANAKIGAGNAQASGTIGRANAWSGALSGAGKGVTDGLTLWSVMNGKK